MQILLNSGMVGGERDSLIACEKMFVWAHLCLYKRVTVYKYTMQLTWVRRHTAFPCLQTGGGVESHLDLFQTPVESSIISDEDQLFNPVTENVSQK